MLSSVIFARIGFVSSPNSKVIGLILLLVVTNCRLAETKSELKTWTMHCEATALFLTVSFVSSSNSISKVAAEKSSSIAEVGLSQFNNLDSVVLPQ